MTRKEELEVRAAQWLMHHGDARLRQPLTALLQQVEREVWEKVKDKVGKKAVRLHSGHSIDFKSGVGNTCYDLIQWVDDQQKELG